MKKIEFYKHNLDATDIAACVKVLKSLFLTTGVVTAKFEKEFAEYINKKYVVALSSCTDALFLSLKSLRVGPGDEVITTPLSFVSSSNAVEYCGAKPIFVDVEKETGNIDANLIEKAITKRTKAILVVHLYGQMCDMKKIKRIALKYKLKIIEDAAHCIEGKRDGIRVGQLGDISCFSFYATKNITSGEGGAIATSNKAVFEWIRKARLHGLSSGAADRYTKKYEHYDMEFLGYKANITDIQSSLLVSQLKKINKYLRIKQKIAKKYDKAFIKNKNVSFPKEADNSIHARHVYSIWVDPKKRDKYMHLLQELNIGVAVNFRPIHLMSYYKNKYQYKKGLFPIAEKIGASTITLPLYPKLKNSEIKYIINSVNKLTV